jgi:hypothetical protein
MIEDRGLAALAPAEPQGYNSMLVPLTLAGVNPMVADAALSLVDQARCRSTRLDVVSTLNSLGSMIALLVIMMASRACLCAGADPRSPRRASAV